MNYIIVTGTSRGIGEAIIRELIQKDNHLFCISRKKNMSLISEANSKGVNLDYFEYDLNNLCDIDKLMNGIFEKVDMIRARGIYLINNAGIISPIKIIDKCDKYDIIKNINVNLTAPMLMVSNFIRLAKDIDAEKRIINISSGAASNPIEGWSCYCSSKSGLDMFTQCVGQEEMNKEYPTKIISFAPGIVDTNMQKEIRSSSEEDFPNLETFIDFKDKGKLKAAKDVAKVIKKVLFDKEFEQGKAVDISDYI
ncbi:(S)-benzoin forming benzil reductase [Alkalithermobacter paradoxus]|uniref:Benzil reductase ((S)-benzoin forming) n=1 Tax=Alkalithermobacter paradoxus TaxID=29349 RepID=A0A1V4ICK3_9FIRM|nr:benzil reductase ((S)-benzoin forming) [[Clostridium] thermoalcaliphilum]